jgi:hypothetical protein
MSSSRAVSWGGPVLVLALGAPLVAPIGASAQYVSDGMPAFGRATVLGGQRQVLRGTAGGYVSLASVNGSCRGYSQPNPSHVLTVAPGVASVVDLEDDQRLAERACGHDDIIRIVV